MTEITQLSRRQTITALAEKYRMPANGIYAAIERAKKSGK
jgi:Mor family transcriptional regulator